MKLLLYALGGGLGHVTRALALGRRATRAGHAATLLVNSAWASALPLEAELGPGGGVIRLAPELDAARAAAPVRELVLGEAWDAVVVDTFPRGLGGELAEVLPSLGTRRVWVHRDLTPRYVAWADLGSFAAAFDLVLVPGEEAPLASLPQARRTAPWLVRAAEELLGRDAARRALGVEDDQPLVVVSGCGRAEEVAETSALATRLAAELGGLAHVRALGPPAAAEGVAWRWPLLELLPGVDVLVGAGGYHTVYEARATGTPLVALARPRRYDRQERRLRPDERAADADAAAGRVRALVAGGPRPRAPIAYPDGAAEGLAAIASL